MSQVSRSAGITTYNSLREWYVTFLLHEYTIHATDVRLTQENKMSDLQEPKNILDIVTPILEAFVGLVMINN